MPLGNWFHLHCFFSQCTEKAVKQNVEFVNGEAGASSEVNKNPASRAFTANGRWESPRVEKPVPAWIWYDFRTRRIRPLEVSFERKDERGRPTWFQFVGSNDRLCDADSDWDVLCEGRSGEASQSCRVDEDRGFPFRCLGIKILEVKPLEKKKNLVILGGIRMRGVLLTDTARKLRESQLQYAY